MRRIAAMMAAAAAAVLCLAAPATASASVHHRWQSPCGAPLRASGKSSLEQYAQLVPSGTASRVLIETLRCYGGNLPRFLALYVDAGNFNSPVPKGTRIWLYASPNGTGPF